MDMAMDAAATGMDTDVAATVTGMDMDVADMDTDMDMDAMAMVTGMVMVMDMAVASAGTDTGGATSIASVTRRGRTVTG